MPCIVLTAFADGGLDYFNARWHEVTGKSQDSHGLDAWLGVLHPDDKNGFVDLWRRSIEASQRFDLRLRVWSHSQKEHRWHVLNVRPHRNRAGGIVRWVGTCQDIHEQKVVANLLRTSETRLKSVIEGSPVGVVILSPTGQPVYYNEKCAELRGHEVELSTWANAVHPDDRERVVKASTEAVASPIAWSDIFRYVHPDGRIVWVSARSVPSHSGSELIGFVRTLEDITELKMAEEKLRKANQELQTHAGRLENEVRERTAKVRETLAELDKLSYSIVHDMRAPLRTMQGFANVLLQEYGERVDDQGKEFLRRIASAAQRQDKLIQDVLAYHSYVRNEFPLAPVNLDQLVGGIVRTYANLQPPKVNIEIRKPLGWALAHETLLMQCVSALLDNAAKFVAPGVTPEIVIFTEKTPNEVKLWIQDNGIGISSESYPKLFDIFYKFHHHDEYPGTGIGLPLTKKAVERMEGGVGVESDLGKGSRFWIVLRTIPVG